MIAYFDSSALVKLLVRERECDVVEELWDRASRRVVSRLAYPEVRAGLAAAIRSGRISADAAEMAIEDLHAAHAASNVVEVDDLLSVEAGELAHEHALRGYEAVHLASLLGVDAPRIVVATWDRELSRAASACGCAVVPALA